jgi:hypothetical protein
VTGRLIALGLIAVAAYEPVVAARPPAMAPDDGGAPSGKFEDCGASPLQARLDAAAKTIFVKDNAVDNAVLKCLNQWGDRNKVRVVLEPVIE